MAAICNCMFWLGLRPKYLMSLTFGGVTAERLLLVIGNPPLYVTNCNVNSAFHPSELGKLVTGLSGWVEKSGGR